MRYLRMGGRRVRRAIAATAVALWLILLAPAAIFGYVPVQIVDGDVLVATIRPLPGAYTWIIAMAVTGLMISILRRHSVRWRAWAKGMTDNAHGLPPNPNLRGRISPWLLFAVSKSAIEVWYMEGYDDFFRNNSPAMGHRLVGES